MACPRYQQTELNMVTEGRQVNFLCLGSVPRGRLRLFSVKYILLLTCPFAFSFTPQIWVSSRSQSWSIIVLDRMELRQSQIRANMSRNWLNDKRMFESTLISRGLLWTLVFLITYYDNQKCARIDCRCVNLRLNPWNLYLPHILRFLLESDAEWCQWVRRMQRPRFDEVNVLLCWNFYQLRQPDCIGRMI